MTSPSYADAQQSLATAVDGFRQRLDAVGDDDWSTPTPCDGWAVSDLVKHLVGGGLMGEMLLDGAGKDDAMATLFNLDLDGDLREAFEDASARQAAAFARPGADEMVCHHPLRDVPGREFIWMRVRDTLVHTWDLARAIGADETLDADLVESMWAQVAPFAEVLTASGMFGEGASGTLSDDASTQDRLLDALGRRP